MQYPLSIRFKLLALTSQMSVTDATGAELFYVKQKMFKLKENIEIYKDSSKTELLYTIKADRVIDFSPTYSLADSNGNVLGTITRQGARSLWRASYDLQLGGTSAHVSEASPWVKVLDGVVGELPIIGIFMGYLFHPKYIVAGPNDAPLAIIEKQPAFFEGVYSLEDNGMRSMDESMQQRFVVLLMMVVLMERTRG
jgi:hypothetical protein